MAPVPTTDQLELLNAEVECSVTELTQLDGKTRLQQALGALEDAVRQPIFGPAPAAPAPASTWLNPGEAARK